MGKFWLRHHHVIDRFRTKSLYLNTRNHGLTTRDMMQKNVCQYLLPVPRSFWQKLYHWKKLTSVVLSNVSLFYESLWMTHSVFEFSWFGPLATTSPIFWVALARIMMEEVFDFWWMYIVNALSRHQVTTDVCDCLQCLFGSEMNHDFMFETLLCNLV